jgi:hypothetical protein
LGLSGLPLLTVSLTLFFSILASTIWFIGLYVHTPGTTPGTDISHDISAALIDLAKLTLGAFIGSFVQRNVSERAAESRPQGQPASPLHGLVQTGTEVKKGA